MLDLADTANPGRATVRILVWLTAIHAVRIVIGASSAIGALMGKVPALFFISGFGDLLVGLFALVVSRALWVGRDASVWAGALVWNAIGVADIANGQLIAILSEETRHMTLPPAVYLIPITLALAHVVSLVLLTRPVVRSYFLNQNRAGQMA
jgi:hypothetical protein